MTYVKHVIHVKEILHEIIQSLKSLHEDRNTWTYGTHAPCISYSLSINVSYCFS